MSFHKDNNWYIKDGNEKGNGSTSRTWLYALEEIETENIIQLLINN